MRRVLLPFALCFVTATVACSDTKTPVAADSGNGGPVDSGVPNDLGVVEDPDSGMVPDGGTGHDDAEVGMDAIPRDPSCPQTAAWITTVKGEIQNDQGQPSAAAKAQMCIRVAPSGNLTCLRPKDSEADGTFAIDVPALYRCIDQSTMRFLRPLEDAAASYCHLELSAAAPSTLQIADPFHIYGTQRATVIPPEGNAMMQRTVEFPGGVELDIVPDTYFPGWNSYAELAAGPIRLMAGDHCGLAGQAEFDAVYAFSPEGDIDGRAGLRLPNTAQLAANTVVNVYVLGSLDCTVVGNDIVPEGTWAQLEDGVVSPDGTTVQITGGIPCLSWIAYRRL